MKRIYRLYDEDINSFLSITYDSEPEAEAARSTIRDYLPEARISIFTDYIPTDLFTVSSRLHDPAGEWYVVTDAGSISEALDLITYRLDMIEESFDYRIAKTDYPDQVILDVIPGAAYPKLERR